MSSRLSSRTALTRPFYLGLFLACGALTGCNSPGFARKAKAPAKPAAPAVGQTETTSAAIPTKEEAGPGIDTAGLSVSGVIAKACGIPPKADGKNLAPSFEFDSSALVEEDRTLLALVAKCLTEGALRGKSVVLTGRTDPRGEDEYNMTLGGSRSDSVKRYMIDLGVGRERLAATSRGEIDATGKDEAGWAQDRRVDVELAK